MSEVIKMTYQLEKAYTWGLNYKAMKLKHHPPQHLNNTAKHLNNTAKTITCTLNVILCKLA